MMNRRFFLRGLGGAALAIPTLTSLLPRTARAETGPVCRYVHLLNPYAPSALLFYGGLSTSQQVATGVRSGDLPAGSWSQVLQQAFTPVRAKTSVLRGLDVQANNPNHQFCFPTCASGYAPGLDGDGFPPQANMESIDVILANSAKTYPDPISATRRVINFNPLATDDYSRSRSFSWRRGGSSLQNVGPLKQTNAILDLFMGSFGMVVRPNDGREVSMLQAVRDDYLRLKGSPRLSADDGRKLDQYVALIADLEREAAAVPTAVCQAPTAEAGSSADAVVRTQLRVLAAAWACDLTRVGAVTMGMSAGYNTRHTEHHAIQDNTIAGGILGDFRGIANNVSWFMQHLDGISDGANGTLLDNSIVYWAMQYGVTTGLDPHSRRDLPVVVGGRGAGRLGTGKYYDFRLNNVGLPLNNLLVTFFNVMGLGSSDYQQNGATGYGLYTGNSLSGRADAATWLSAAGKRAPLPGLYTGPALG